MSLQLPSLPTMRRADLLLVWGAVIGAWAITIVLLATGGGSWLVDHDDMLENRHFGPVVTLVLLLGTWQLMTAAMMLPSSLPMIAMFRRVAQRDAHPWRRFGTFLLGYFAIWTGFAVVALLGDAGLHSLSDNVRAVGERPWVFGGAVLVVAGGFQFSNLKEKCLDACRDPMAFLWQHYIAGSRSAWHLGIRHGLFCLGCCWALMLTMFAVGMGSLVWMVALTGIMVMEKVTRYGNRLAAPVGVALIVWGGLIILQPDWLPVIMRFT
jgi:predicted metal-binding membrane protein